MKRSIQRADTTRKIKYLRNITCFSYHSTFFDRYQVYQHCQVFPPLASKIQLQQADVSILLALVPDNSFILQEVPKQHELLRLKKEIIEVVTRDLLDE